MRAVTVVALDGPSAVDVRTVDEPAAGPGQVVIDVQAMGVTYPDVLVTYGRYQLRPPVPFVPGTQVAGTVRSAPAGSGFTAGDRVCAFTLFGGFAEVVVVDPGQVFALPDNVSVAAGAAALTNYLTAHFVLSRRGRLSAGETVLVHGAAGGVGMATIQVAKALGARVLAVVSTQAKADAVLRAGADVSIMVDGFRDAVREATGGAGVDIVVDPVGGDRFTDSLRSLAPEGRLIVVGFVGGDIPVVKVNRLLLNNIDVVGAAWGEYASSRPGYLHEQWSELVPMFADGRLAPVIEATLPMVQAAEALRRLDDREVIGNVVLEP